MIGRNRVWQVTRHDRPDGPANAKARRNRNHPVTQFAPRKAFLWRFLWQDIKGQQHQDNSHHLDRDLRQGKIRCRQIDKAKRDNQTNHTDQ